MICRPATQADLDALVSVQERGGIAGLAHIFPQDEHPFPRAEIRRRWAGELDNPQVRAFVCTGNVDDSHGADDDTVTGFAATRENELLHFGTTPESWGSGLAQAFHDTVVAGLVRDLPSEHSYLRLRVFEANRRARRFYERLGWTESGRRTRTLFAPHPVLVEYRRPVGRGD